MPIFMRRTLMGIDHDARTVVQDGSEPLAGQHCATQNLEFYG